MSAKAKDTKKKKDEPAHPWRDNIEAITMAIILAVMLKYFIVEAYRIPTGSMQPTLMGNAETNTHDRILVDKLSYHFRDPKRWEIVVFHYPLDLSKNFIKRICGMPNEELRIENGDLWHKPDGAEEWSILRRPEKILGDMLKALVPSGAKGPQWRVTSGGKQWQVDVNSIEARGPGTARFPRQGAVMDRYQDGYPGTMGSKLVRRGSIPATNAVGDLRITGRVRGIDGCKSVRIELQEGNRRYRFSIPGPDAAPDMQATLEIPDYSRPNGAAEATPPQVIENVRLGKQWSDFEAQNIDDEVRLIWNGKIVFTTEVDPARDQSSGALLAVEGSGADFDDLMVYRDVFYTHFTARNHPWKIPGEHYVMLGDNTQDSSDAREWTLKRYELSPEAYAATYPGGDGPSILRANHHGPNINPMVIAGLPGGAVTRLRDEWGELHFFAQDEITALPPEGVSMVPRELITGRALLVFWPFKLGIGVYRLKWIR